MKKFTITFIMLTMLILSACGNNDNALEEGSLVEVNGVQITQADLDSTITEFYGEEPIPPESMEEIQAGILQYLVQKQIIALEAERLNITEEVIKEEYLNKLKELGLDGEEFTDEEIDSNTALEIQFQLIITELANISDEAIETHFQENKESYEEVTVRHILISNEEHENSLEKATEVYNQIKANENMTEEDFAKLVVEHSNDPGSIETGGEYTFTRNDQFVEEFKQTAFEQEVGDISEPVETSFGYHIIFTTDKKEPTLEDSKESVKMMLLNEQAPEILEGLMDDANVNVIDSKYEDLF